MLEQLMILVPLLPWLAAVLIALTYLFGHNRGEQGERLTAMLSTAGISLSLLLLLALDIQLVITHSLPGQIVYADWFAIQDTVVWFSLNLDRLGITMANLFVLLLLVTLRFSVFYMHREDGFQRFFIVLNLFCGAMLWIVLAGSAMLTFVGWEIAGISSYLLIGYAINRRTATKNAARVFITNRIGDAGFMLGMILAFHHVGSIEWPILFSATTQLPNLVSGIIASGFVIAALVKSAQLPFSAWIARALEGPTPSSAIFYGSLLVHAGVYLVLRLQPLLENAPVIMTTIMILGALTAIYGYLSGLTQSDVKSALIFSTISQVGLMFVMCGLGWFNAATIYLIAHAIWRTYQFLHAPSMMHWMHRPTQQVPNWLTNNVTLYSAAQSRFWLDDIADRLLNKPMYALARDLRYFDEQVVNRMVGLPSSVSAVSSLAQWDAQKANAQSRISGDTGLVGHGRGVAGKLMQWLATPLHWIEEHLVLKGGEKGVQQSVRHLGKYISAIEKLLCQPRYIWLIIIITLTAVI